MFGRTRNSIIGKAHRLKLERLKSGPKPIKTAGANEARKKSRSPTASAKVWVKPRPPLRYKPVRSEIVIPDGTKTVPLLKIKDGQCKAIIGYPNGALEKAVCCGEPVTGNKITGQPVSWCAYHRSIYFEPPKERQR
jgi:hypothetical protein